MRILALDYGSAHTGVAICDPTGTVVRPLTPVSDADKKVGLEAIAKLVRSEGAGAVLVGMPVSLAGTHSAQADATGKFIIRLKEILDVPVLSWDERFTSKLAREKARSSDSSSHSLAACILLESFLGSREYRHFIEPSQYRKS